MSCSIDPSYARSYASKPKFWTVLQNAIADFLYTLPIGDELKVWQSSDRDGTVRWCVYAPNTHKIQCFISKEDALMWIEQPHKF